MVGSKRTSYFKEPKSSKRYSGMRTRSQNVRFRRKMAASLLQDTGRKAWILAKVTLVLGVLGWGGIQGHRFWTISPAIRVSNLVFLGDVPPPLEKHFPIAKGENLFLLHTVALEKEILRTYPELKTFQIARRLNREVQARGQYRSALAVVIRSGAEWGLDENGVLFPIHDYNKPSEKLPVLLIPSVDSMSAEGFVRLSSMLRRLAKDLPNFYSQVSRVDVDRLMRVTFVMKDDVSILWGELNGAVDSEKAENILRLREKFTPKKKPATLRFVTENRVVMDSNWSSSR